MIKVTWDDDTCIRSLDCCSQLPKCFREENDKIIIELSGCTDDAVREVVKRCPSGALKIEE